MSQEKRLRFPIRTRDQEIELEGDFEYVREKFESLVENLRLKDGIVPAKPETVQTLETSEPSDLLKGIVQFSGEGRPYLTVPADSLSAKEALALVLYATHPKTFGDDELSTLLGSSWKTTSGAVVRARASELKREPKLMGMQLVTEDNYRRFVAGKQHVKIENVDVEIGRPWRIKEFGPPKDYKSEEFTVWSFPSRGDWATHSGNYRGNWSPYIPRNL